MRGIFYLMISISLILSTKIVVASEEKKSYQWSTSFGNKGLQIRKQVTQSKMVYISPFYWFSRRELSSQDLKEHILGIRIGIRNYLSNSEIKTYLDSDVRFGYTVRIDTEDRKQYEVSLKYGIENEITKKVSVEGAAGVALSYDQYYSNNSSYLLTAPFVSVAMNYYF